VLDRCRLEGPNEEFWTEIDDNDPVNAALSDIAISD
jgi:hypothetical protein